MMHYNFLLRLFNYNDLDIKVISFWSALISVFVSFANDYLGISAGFFFLLFLIMITDYITGLSASKYEEKNKAKKENRKPYDVFSSKKGLGWVFKFGSYIIFLYFSLLFNDYIKLKGLDFMSYVAKVTHFYILIHIFYWEFKSVDENFERLGYDFKVFHIFWRLFDIATRLVENIIEPLKKKK